MFLVSLVSPYSVSELRVQELPSLESGVMSLFTVIKSLIDHNYVAIELRVQELLSLESGVMSLFNH
jgi:hypothetical protein